jgi:carbamoyl-phosphate synthase small subunit
MRNNVYSFLMAQKAVIVLADGHVFEGKSFGAPGCVTGEAVFTTGMTGYLETLTDPSYYGQIVMQTFPLIGNYGVIPADFESARIQVKGYIVRDWCRFPSNFRSEGDVDSFLKKNGVVGLYGIDTRRLTKIIRESGVMNARLIALSGDAKKDGQALAELAMLEDPQSKLLLLAQISAYTIEGAVEAVTLAGRAIEESAEQVFERSAAYRSVPVTRDGLKINDPAEAAERGRGKRVALVDYGAKANIRRELLKRGLDVLTVEAHTTCAEIMRLGVDGVMLTNGPGDPAVNTGIIEETGRLMATGIPVFGICLGHQLMALAAGAKTEKLKYGHRGANQPVKELSSGRVFITCQNHGYAVVSDTLPKGARLSFVNTNDGTCEGVEYTDNPCFSVQFHPEASGGPLDAGFLFDRFVDLMQAPR